MRRVANAPASELFRFAGVNRIRRSTWREALTRIINRFLKEENKLVDERQMSAYEFTLVLSGVAEITPELADALYLATGGDIEFNMRNEVAYIQFDRAAATLRDAVSSAIAQVEGAGIGVRVVRVESDAANTIAKINADLLGVGLRE